MDLNKTPLELDCQMVGHGWCPCVQPGHKVLSEALVEGSLRMKGLEE